MSEGRPAGNRRAPRGVLRAALVCASAALVPVYPALAQQDLGAQLRGEISETDTNDDLLSTVPLSQKRTALDDQKVKAPKKDEGIPAPTFDPSSEGATPDETGPRDGPSSFYSDHTPAGTRTLLFRHFKLPRMTASQRWLLSLRAA